MSASLGDLNDAVIGSLRESGKLQKITAEIRAEIFKILTSDKPDNDDIPLCKENFIINELIREYLEFNGYTNTLSVFMGETGQPEEPMDRDFLAHSLDVLPHNQIPILYSMTSKGGSMNQSIISKDKPSSKQTQKVAPVKVPPLYGDSDSSESDGFFEIKGK